MSPSVSVRLLLSQSDERLVGYARAGHERAFEALVQRYRRQLLAYCRRLLLSEQRAEDALQQALLQAWVALDNGAEVREPRAWLYRIVHNAAVQTLRVSRYDYCQLNESLSGADAPQADLDRRIAVREALAGLATLPEMQREALLRTALEGRTHQQAAAELGLSEPALRGLVYRARASLRAAASAILPPPLIGWALEAGTGGAPALEQAAGLGAGGGAAGLAGLLIKGSAVAVTAGALASGIVASHAHHASADRVPASTAKAEKSTRSTAVAAAKPASFTRSGDARAALRPQLRSGATFTPAKGLRLISTRRRPHWPAPSAHRQAPADRPSAPAHSWSPPPNGHPRHGDGAPAETAEGAHDGQTAGVQHSDGGHERDGRGDEQPSAGEIGHDGGGPFAEAEQVSPTGESDDSGHDGKDDGSSADWQNSGSSGWNGYGYKDNSLLSESPQQQYH